MHGSFFNEVDKLAAGKANFSVSKTRVGRRPMRVDTMLKKEKDGSLFLQRFASVPNPHPPRLKNLYDPDESEKQAAGTAEAYIPWYGTALGGTSGALLGESLVPKKYRSLGMLGGTLLGTAAGLHGGEALGRTIDKTSAKKDENPLELSGGEPTHEVRIRVRGYDADTSVKNLLKRVHEVGAPGHSFSIIEKDPPDGKEVNLGGWDGDGGTMITSIETIPLEKKKEARAQRAVELLSTLAKKKGLDPKNIGAIQQVANVAGHDRSRAAEIAKNVKGYLKTAEAAILFLKLADKVLYRGDLVGSSAGNGDTQHPDVPVTSRRKPGDAPTAGDMYGHSPSRYDVGHSPPETKIAEVLSVAVRRTLMPMDEHPGDAPDRHTPNPNRLNLGFEHRYIGSVPDPQPITEVETDSAYSRA